MNPPVFTGDQCLKCNICLTACPVSAIADCFPGPKTVGPQAQRFRLSDEPIAERSLEYCSGCGLCSLACPQGVPIAEINTLAKAAQTRRYGLALRNRLLGRSEWLGRIGSRLTPLSNILLHNNVLRLIGEIVLGISRQAPLPHFAPQTFRAWYAARAPEAVFSRQPTTIPPPSPAQPTVVYFHGCSVNYYEPEIGRAAVRVLELNGYRVIVPPQKCCGLPLQSNGELEAARAYAAANIRWLAPYAYAGYPILGTSSSCTLMLKRYYRTILGLDGEAVEAVAQATEDICEFLGKLAAAGRLNTTLRPWPQKAAYHAACQLRSHGIGLPALELLSYIPNLEVIPTLTDCCGIAGTYGLKVEKYALAQAIGQATFAAIRASGATCVVCDSETCRWWLGHHTGLPTKHPIEILAAAYDSKATGG